MNIDMKCIGKRIKDRRKELNLTQLDIKKECGISSGALSEIENGNRTPSIVIFFLLAQSLKCSIDWLTTGNSSDFGNSSFSEYEDKLLMGFRELSDEDRNELIEILYIKLRKTRKKKK